MKPKDFCGNHLPNTHGLNIEEYEKLIESTTELQYFKVWSSNELTGLPTHSASAVSAWNSSPRYGTLDATNWSGTKEKALNLSVQKSTIKE